MTKERLAKYNRLAQLDHRLDCVWSRYYTRPQIAKLLTQRNRLILELGYDDNWRPWKKNIFQRPFRRSVTLTCRKPTTAEIYAHQSILRMKGPFPLRTF